VHEVKSLSRANAILERQGEIKEMNELVSVIARERDEARNEAEHAKKEAAIVAGLRRQIDEQKRAIEKLENELATAEFKRSSLELENSQLAAEFKPQDDKEEIEDNGN
jgi:predicted RNase H-like nuclease (RuvC/YqgF family)